MDIVIAKCVVPDILGGIFSRMRGLSKIEELFVEGVNTLKQSIFEGN